MTDSASILLTISTTVIGSVASWFTSRWYYRRSSSDLENALQPLDGKDQQLIQATNAIVRMLEQAGIGKPTYDAAGNLTGVVVTASAHLVARSRLSATGTSSPPPQYDRQQEQPEPETRDGVDA